MTGGYILLDLTKYVNEDVDLLLYDKLLKIAKTEKPVCAKIKLGAYESVSPIFTNLCIGAGEINMSFNIYDEVWEFSIASDGTITFTSLDGE